MGPRRRNPSYRCWTPVGDELRTGGHFGWVRSWNSREFGPARKHFKTCYFRWEIIVISRWQIYLSLPALAVTAYIILVFKADDLVGTVFGVDATLAVVGAGFIIDIAPVALFLAYILQVVSVVNGSLPCDPKEAPSSPEPTVTAVKHIGSFS